MTRLPIYIVSMGVSAEELDALDDLCRHEGITRARLMRSALYEYLGNHDLPVCIRSPEEACNHRQMRRDGNRLLL